MPASSEGRLEAGATSAPSNFLTRAQKAALVNLAKAIAVDHAHQGIRANSLSPGPTETARFVRKFESLEKARASGETLFNRLADPVARSLRLMGLRTDEPFTRGEPSCACIEAD